MIKSSTSLSSTSLPSTSMSSTSMSSTSMSSTSMQSTSGTSHAHTSRAVYQCDVCPKVFRSSYWKKLHMKVMHEEKDAGTPCKECNKTISFLYKVTLQTISYNLERHCIKYSIIPSGL